MITIPLHPISTKTVLATKCRGSGSLILQHSSVHKAKTCFLEDLRKKAALWLLAISYEDIRKFIKSSQWIGVKSTKDRVK